MLGFRQIHGRVHGGGSSGGLLRLPVRGLLDYWGSDEALENSWLSCRVPRVSGGLSCVRGFLFFLHHEQSLHTNCSSNWVMLLRFKVYVNVQ